MKGGFNIPPAKVQPPATVSGQYAFSHEDQFERAKHANLEKYKDQRSTFEECQERFCERSACADADCLDVIESHKRELLGDDRSPWKQDPRNVARSSEWLDAPMDPLHRYRLSGYLHRADTE